MINLLNKQTKEIKLHTFYVIVDSEGNYAGRYSLRQDKKTKEWEYITIPTWDSGNGGIGGLFNKPEEAEKVIDDLSTNLHLTGCNSTSFTVEKIII